MHDLKMATHFKTIAPVYRTLRELDGRAVRRVSLELRQLATVMGGVSFLDVGAGTGRYTDAVLPDRSVRADLGFRGVACDAISEMLRGGAANHGPRATGIDAVVGLSESLPFATKSFDAVLSFNAIHHFDLQGFLSEVGRVLRSDGRLIVYTRSPEQNRRTIWGQYFPHFAEREARLYTENALIAAFEATKVFTSLQLLDMPWTIRTSLSRLLDQARSGAYSTFRFYSAEELDDALDVFETQVKANFADPSAITARNDHTLVLASRR